MTAELVNFVLCKEKFANLICRTLDGTWIRIHTMLLKLVRVQAGRDPQPRTGIVDSQTVKTIGVGVERTLSWLGQSHRLSKDYERPCTTSEAFINIAEGGAILADKEAQFLRLE